MKKALNTRLKKAMDLKGLKAVDLCERLNIPKSAMSYYINGKQEPKADRLHDLAKVLDVSEAWLLGYDVSMERDAEQKSNDDFEAAIRRIEKDMEFRQIVIKLNGLNPQQLSLVVSMMDQFRKE